MRLLVIDGLDKPWSTPRFDKIPLFNLATQRVPRLQRVPQLNYRAPHSLYNPEVKMRDRKQIGLL